MTENMNEQNKHELTDGNAKTLKFLTVCLCAFLGGLAGIYFINKTAPIAPQYGFPYEMQRQHHRGMHDFNMAPDDFRNPPEFNPDFQNKKPIAKAPFINSVANLEEMPDSYKLYVNLRRFNNDEKNVKVDITKHSIKINGKFDSNKKGEQSSFVYKNELVLPREIEVSKVKKELVHGKLIYTLPLDD